MKSLERTVTIRDRRFLLRVETSDEPSDYADVRGPARGDLGLPRRSYVELPQHDVRERLPRGREPVHRRLRRSPRRRLRRRRGRPGRLLLRLRRRPRQGDRVPRPANLRFYAQYAGRPQGLPELRAGHPPEGVPAGDGPRPPGRLDHHLHLRSADRRQRQPQRPPFRHGRPGIPRGHLRRVRRPPQPARRPHGPLPDVLGPRQEERPAGPGCRGRPGRRRRPSRPATRRVAGRGGALDLEVVEGTDPDVAGDPLLVRVPLDFYRMLQETDVADAGGPADPCRLAAGHARRLPDPLRPRLTGSSISSRRGPGRRPTAMCFRGPSAPAR